MKTWKVRYRDHQTVARKGGKKHGAMGATAGHEIFGGLRWASREKWDEEKVSRRGRNPSRTRRHYQAAGIKSHLANGKLLAKSGENARTHIVRQLNADAANDTHALLMQRWLGDVVSPQYWGGGKTHGRESVKESGRYPIQHGGMRGGGEPRVSQDDRG